MATWDTPAQPPVRTRAGAVALPMPTWRAALLDALPGLAALLVLAGGLLHLDLWNDGYRNVDNVGVMFLVNGVASIVVAVALVLWRHWIPALAGFGLSLGTLVAFGVSRTDWDVLGFNEVGWNPSPEAALSVIVEVAAAVSLLVVLSAWALALAARRSGPPAPPPITGRDGLPRLTPPAG